MTATCKYTYCLSPNNLVAPSSDCLSNVQQRALVRPGFVYSADADADAEACNVAGVSCNVGRVSCNITGNTRTITGNTCMITRNTCNITRNVCNITRNTCKLTRVRIRVRRIHKASARDIGDDANFVKSQLFTYMYVCMYIY